jgi:putative GTP pyrophosphokinase
MDDIPQPHNFPRDAGGLVWDYRRQFSYPMTMVNANLRYYVRKEGAPIIIAQRLKRLPRIIEKLSRHPRMRLSQMQDIGGCRAIVPTQTAADNVLAGIVRNWEILAVDNYAANPRPTGYRAIHAIVRRANTPIEVQIRTTGQQDWADEIERIDSLAGYGLKDGFGPPDVLEYTQILAEVIAKFEAGHTVSTETIRRLQHLQRDIP